MKKSMESAYTDMMNNLAKSTAAIPLHLQAASGALAWWEQPDSLLAKSEIAPAEEASEALAKASAENETDEAYEEDEKKDAEKESDEDEKEESEDEEEESDEDPEPAEEGMKKSIAGIALAAAAAPVVGALGGVIAQNVMNKRSAKKRSQKLDAMGKVPKMVSDPVYDVNKALSELDGLATEMLAKADTYLKGQTEMFPDMPVPSETYEEKKAKKSKKKPAKQEEAQ